jgi:hypothetical protein
VQVSDGGWKNIGSQFGMSHLLNWRKSMFLPSPSQAYCHLSSAINSGIRRQLCLQDCRAPPSYRWPPGTLQHQGPPSNPQLYDLAAWLLPFLDDSSQAKLVVVNRAFNYGPTGYPSYFYRPWSPLVWRRRWGFGIPSTNRSAMSDCPTVVLAMLFA